MAPINFIVSALLAASALLLIGLAIPLIRGSVPTNPWYGVRFRASFTSPDAWYAINRYGGWQAVGWSLPLFVLAGLALWLPLATSVPATVILLLSPVIVALTATLATYRYARRLDREP